MRRASHHKGPHPRLIEGYGWIPDLPDARDLMLAQVQRPKKLSELPDPIDLRDQWYPPTYDQDGAGSCTGNGWSGAIQYRLARQGSPPLAGDGVPSRLFIYFNERMIEGTTDYDSGAQIRDGIKTVARQGACPESEWPYDVSKLAVQPSDACYTDAARHVVQSYMRVAQTPEAICTALAAGYPVVFGFSVYQSFETIGSDGMMPMPGSNESILGGHCVVFFGAQISKKLYICRNSWGDAWGDCLTGDARVSLLNGTAPTIGEINAAGKDVWVYSYDPHTQRVVPALATPRCAGYRDDLVRVTLDNGEVVTCTGDHPWMLRDGSFQRAEHLTPGTSLMPLYRNRDRYEAFQTPETHKWITTHWAVARHLNMRAASQVHEPDCDGACRLVVHHKDFDGCNNEPDNLEVMFYCQHLRLHRDLGRRNGDAMRRQWRDHRDEMLPQAVAAMRQYNESLARGDVSPTERQIAARRESGRRLGQLPKGPITEAQREARRRNVRTMLAKRPQPVANSGSFTSQAPNNHSVVSAEPLSVSLPVYDLSVDSPGHNFALAAGVFVHNSGVFYMPWDFAHDPNYCSDFWVAETVEG